MFLFLLLTFNFQLSTILFGQQPGPVSSINALGVQNVGPANWPYGADVNLYVNASTGNDSTGNGTSASPYSTIARALQDVPEFVSQHYLINLAAGTYYEQVNITGRYFGTNLVTNFKQAAIEIKGNPAAPDSYVISGATAALPTTPSRNFGVANSGGNLILNGLSIQYASQVNLWQSGGVTVTNNVTLRHATTAAPGGYQGLGASGMYVWNGLAVMMGTLTVSDVYNGIFADHHALITATGDPVNSGFSFGTESVTGVTGGVGIGAYVNSEIDTDGQGSPVILTGTNVAGSVGIQSEFFSDVWWDGGTIGSFPTLVDAEVGGLVTGSWFAFQNATTGILLTTGGRFETFTTATVTFTGVTTPRSIVQGGMSFEPSGNYFDGSLTSTGAVSLAAGGTNQNVTLTPSGTGAISLAGSVSIPGSSSWINLSQTNYLGGDTIFRLPGSPWTVNAFISGSTGNSYFSAAGGNVGVGTSTPQTKLDVSGPIRASAVTFATLPACSATIEGALRGVTDSTVATWGSTITGAGTNHVLAYCDGTAWTVAAK